MSKKVLIRNFEMKFDTSCFPYISLTLNFRMEPIFADFTLTLATKHSKTESNTHSFITYMKIARRKPNRLVKFEQQVEKIRLLNRDKL